MSCRLSGVQAPVFVFDLDGVSQRRGAALDGLIGAPLLASYVVEIDYETKTMKLYDPSTYAYEGSGEILPIRLRNGMPVVRATIMAASSGAIEGDFIIDSPAFGPITFAAPFVRRFNLLAASCEISPNPIADELFGVGGASKLWSARLSEFRIGRYVFRRPIAEFTEATGGTFAEEDIAAASSEASCSGASGSYTTAPGRG